MQQLNQFHYHVIRTARDGIDALDRERRNRGISQMRIAELADNPDVGQTYARMFRSGDARLSKYLRFLRETGFELVMVKKEELDNGGSVHTEEKENPVD